jgi:hypothetical protein
VQYFLQQAPENHYVAGRAVSADGADTQFWGPLGDSNFNGNDQPKWYTFDQLRLGVIYTITLLASDQPIDPDVDFDPPQGG